MITISHFKDTKDSKNIESLRDRLTVASANMAKKYAGAANK